MEIIKSNCPACGAPLDIPENRQKLYCSSCGSSLTVQHSEHEVTLIMTEKIVAAIEQAGNSTQDAIRENAFATKTELQRLQLSQQLSTLQLQLSSLQTEIRAMERNPGQTTTARLANLAQLQNLYQNEYQLLDQMHSLQRQISAPDPSNLKACIDFANLEIGWINTKIASLTKSNHPGKSQLINSLKTRTQELTRNISEWKVVELRKSFASFKQVDPQPTNLPGIRELLSLVNADEQRARAFRYTTEGAVVHNEIKTRQQRLQSWLIRGDQNQLGGILQSNQFQPNPDDKESLARLLQLINQDLALDMRGYEPGVARGFQNALLKRKEQTQRQISRIEYRLEHGRNPGCLAAILAALPAGVASLLLGKAAKSQQKAGERVSQPSQSSISENVISRTPMPVTPVNQTSRSSSGAATAGGCLLGLLTFFVFFVIGVLVIPSGDQGAETATGLVMALFMFIIALGLTIGATIFLLLAGPRLTVRGFGIRPDLVLFPKREGKGIRNASVVRLLIGMFLLLISYSIFLTVIAAVTDLSNVLAAILFLISLVLGPVVAIVIARRIEIS